MAYPRVPDSPSASPSARLKTPSDLKWLLNERAALEGQAQLTSERQSTLERQLARLSLEPQEASSEPTQTRDGVAATADRGALTEFVREHLRALSPYASLAADIQRHAVEHFGLQFATPQQRNRCR